MATKKRRPKKAAPDDIQAAGPEVEHTPDADILIDTSDALPDLSDPLGGPIEIPLPDGDLVIDLNPQPAQRSTKFDDNLAEFLDAAVLIGISNPLLEGIDEDERDRAEWIQQRADGLDLLGNKIEKPGAGNVGQATTAVPGQSTVRDPLLAEAVDRFQANAYAELCPSAGPCKVVNYGDETAESEGLAESLEKDFNYYLQNIAREYCPDMRRMLFWTGYASGMFRKVYRCPLRRRPVSESVDGADLIIPSNVTDLHNAGRITHQINMRQSTMKRMQLLGIYRDVPLTPPTPIPNVLVTKEGNIVGLNPNPQRMEDQDYTCYEIYCELDIPGFEHKEGGKETGLPLPYRVCIDKDSRIVLEVRRNWNDGDPDYKAKIPFVLFPYATGLGIYGTGLLHRLGNLTMALTAMLRECIDAGMFASFPGFLFAKPVGRQLQNQFRVPPGGGAPIDVSAVGGDISKAVMPLPYKDVSVAMVGLMAQIREAAARYGGTADAPVGEGVQNAPVGTTLALIEQATKIEGGVHKALHSAQAEEFRLLKELFREDPESLWRGNARPAMGKDMPTRLAKFRAALEDCEIEPASDPNVPSHMHRLAKAASLLQLAQAYPTFINGPVAVLRAMDMMHIDDAQSLIAPPQQAPPPDPIAMAGIQLKQQDQTQKGHKMLIDAQSADADRKSRESIEALRIAERLVTHPESQPSVNSEMQDLSPEISPGLNGGDPNQGGPNRGVSHPAAPGVFGMQGGPPTVPGPPMAPGGRVHKEPGGEINDKRSLRFEDYPQGLQDQVNSLYPEPKDEPLMMHHQAPLPYAQPMTDDPRSLMTQRERDIFDATGGPPAPEVDIPTGLGGPYMGSALGRYMNTLPPRRLPIQEDVPVPQPEEQGPALFGQGGAPRDENLTRELAEFLRLYKPTGMAS